MRRDPDACTRDSCGCSCDSYSCSWRSYLCTCVHWRDACDSCLEKRDRGPWKSMRYLTSPLQRLSKRVPCPCKSDWWRTKCDDSPCKRDHSPCTRRTYLTKRDSYLTKCDSYSRDREVEAIFASARPWGALGRLAVAVHGLTVGGRKPAIARGKPADATASLSSRPSGSVVRRASSRDTCARVMITLAEHPITTASHTIARGATRVAVAKRMVTLRKATDTLSRVSLAIYKPTDTLPRAST